MIRIIVLTKCPCCDKILDWDKSFVASSWIQCKYCNYDEDWESWEILGTFRGYILCA